MSVEIRVLRGSRAVAALQDPGFAADWRRLADDDPRGTIFQHEDYCRAWYDAYADRLEPFLVTGVLDGQLAALLCLAVADDRVCHAGDHQCEYQGWLVAPDAAADFPPRALAAVFASLDVSRWEWRNTAPGLDLGWLDHLPRSGPGGVSRETTRCPLLNAGDDAFIRARTKGRLRSYRNRLERRGLRYERVTDPQAAAVLLERLATWCDLRQGAVHGTLPFADDPAKHDFHRRLLARPERFWLSGLFLDADPVAAHLGPFDGDELALGVQGYDPREGKLSPGAILIFELAADVAASGGRFVDLTPGGDAWKERYASEHRDVERLVFHRHAVAVVAGTAVRGVERGARAALRRLGAEPGRIREALELVTGGRDTDAAAATATDTYELAVGTASWSTGQPPGEQPSPEDADALFRAHAAWLGAEAAGPFLAAATRCLAEGWQPVTLVREDRLAGLVWRSPGDAWIDLTDPDAPRARGGKPGKADPALPDDVLLLRADPPCGWLPEREAQALLELARSADHRPRAWLLTGCGLPDALGVAVQGPVRRPARAS